MSIIFQQLVRGDGILHVTTDPVPAQPDDSQGLLVNANGDVYADFTPAVIERYYYGLPYTAEGALVLSANPVSYLDQGIPFAADGGIAVNLSPAFSTYNQGVAYGPSGAIVADTGMPPQNPPDQVTQLAATAILDGLFLDWTQPDSPDSPINNYLVQYKLASEGTFTTLSIGFVNPPQYSLNGLIGGETYDVRVAAENIYGTGPYSTIVQGFPLELPPQVQNLVAVAGDQEVDLTWDAIPVINPPISSYDVEYKLNSSGTWIEQLVGNVTAHTVTGLTNGLLYDFRVQALNSEGAGPHSTVQQATPEGLPAQVTGLALTAGDTVIDATWNAQSPSPPVTDYVVEWSLAGMGVWTTQSVGTLTSFQITGLTNGQLYDVRVKAVNALGDGPYSAIEQDTPEAPVVELVLLYDENGVDTSFPLTFWNNTGTLAGAYDYTSVNGNALSPVQQNGLDVAQFNGGSRLICSNQGPLIPQPYTIYVSGVGFTNTSEGRYWFEGQVTATSFRVNQFDHWAFAGTSLFAGAGGSFSNVVYAIVFDGANSRIVAQGGVSFDVTGNAGTNDYATESMGWDQSQSNTNESFNGKIFEKRVYNGAHDTTTINATLSAIRSKYGF